MSLRCRILAAVLLLGCGLAPGAEAGVPRSCVHPNIDRMACIRDTAAVRDRVLPSARLRALERERARLERLAPREDRQRNRLLRRILRRMR